MPIIEIDEDLYYALNNMGKTEDAWSDVIWRLVRQAQLNSNARSSCAEISVNSVGPEKFGDALDYRSFDDLLTRYLPPQWKNAPRRADEIRAVIGSVLRQPRSVSIREREIRARKEVAEQFGVHPNTVLDKCARQLDLKTGGFRQLLGQIEHEFLRG